MTGAEKRGGGIRRVAANLALVGAALLGLFALFELGFRLVTTRDAGPRPGQGWAIHDRELGYRPRPHFADHNAQGLRNDPIAARKTRFRILVLGDSVTVYGDSPADTYPGRLERLLNRDTALPPVEVINAGVRGYTNYQELLFLEKVGLALEPDLVGVGFVLNDLHRILHRFAIEDGEIVGEEYAFTDEAIQSVGSPLYRLARSSRFLVWLRHRLGIFDRLIELYSGDGFVFDYRPDFSAAWRADSWGPVEVQLGELVELGRRNGFRVFLVGVSVVAPSPEVARIIQERAEEFRVGNSGEEFPVQAPLRDSLPGHHQIARDVDGGERHIGNGKDRRRVEHHLLVAARQKVDGDLEMRSRKQLVRFSAGRCGEVDVEAGDVCRDASRLQRDLPG